MSKEILRDKNKISYFLDGQLHRDDGPAIEFLNGSKIWYQFGKKHRIDGGPAVDLIDGHKEWFTNGVLHRLDGPAVKWSNGYKEYWINGVKYNVEEFNKLNLNQGGTKMNASNTSTNSRDLISIKDAAELLNIGVSKIYRKIYQRELHTVRVKSNNSRYCDHVNINDLDKVFLLAGKDNKSNQKDSKKKENLLSIKNNMEPVKISSMSSGQVRISRQSVENYIESNAKIGNIEDDVFIPSSQNISPKNADNIPVNRQISNKPCEKEEPQKFIISLPIGELSININEKNAGLMI